MATQRFCNLHLLSCAFVAVAGYAPALSPLRARIYFVSGVDNLISDCPFRSLDLTNNQLLAYLDTKLPQTLTWRLWTPLTKIVSRIASELRQKTSVRGCLLAEPLTPMATGPNGPTSAQGWLLTPYSSLIKTLYPSSTPLLGTTGKKILHPTAVQYNPEMSRMPYGRLDRRLRFWEPKTHR